MSDVVVPLAGTLDEGREAQKVLSLGQVALWLKLSREEVVKLAASGELPGRLVGDEWKFGVLAINRWLSGERAAGELAGLEAALATVTTRVEELAARIKPLLDALPQLPQGKMVTDGSGVAFDVPDGMTLEALESEYIRHILQKCQHNKAHAAEALGIDASTLYRKLSRLGWQ